MTEPAEIVDRKRSHFDLCAHQDVEFRNKTTLLEDVELLNQPLIESRLEDIDLSVTVLGKRLNYPIIITGMTGGAEEVGRFNRDIASVAEKMGLGFGQRSALMLYAFILTLPWR
jgi:isopentenyl-diphosphate delta-isomerase